MGKYRSKLQVMADILLVANEGARKTRIMFGANLNYRLLNQYLAEAMNAGLVDFKGSAGYYRLTRKGWEFLKRYGEYAKRYRRLEGLSKDVDREKAVLERMCFNAKQMDKSNS